ncbi:MAG: class I SAM-dependent methyltransferase [Candidatus Gygaella obscura]|nr:class I SAM-dependent methyltransferase [Candidatus Gygaella obscura]
MAHTVSSQDHGYDGAGLLTAIGRFLLGVGRWSKVSVDEGLIDEAINYITTGINIEKAKFLENVIIRRGPPSFNKPSFNLINPFTGTRYVFLREGASLEEITHELLAAKGGLIHKEVEELVVRLAKSSENSRTRELVSKLGGGVSGILNENFPAISFALTPSISYIENKKLIPKIKKWLCAIEIRAGPYIFNEFNKSYLERGLHEVLAEILRRFYTATQKPTNKIKPKFDNGGDKLSNSLFNKKGKLKRDVYVPFKDISVDSFTIKETVNFSFENSSYKMPESVVSAAKICVIACKFLVIVICLGLVNAYFQDEMRILNNNFRLGSELIITLVGIYYLSKIIFSWFIRDVTNFLVDVLDEHWEGGQKFFRFCLGDKVESLTLYEIKKENGIYSRIPREIKVKAIAIGLFGFHFYIDDGFLIRVIRWVNFVIYLTPNWMGTFSGWRSLKEISSELLKDSKESCKKVIEKLKHKRPVKEPVINNLLCIMDAGDSDNGGTQTSPPDTTSQVTSKNNLVTCHMTLVTGDFDNGGKDEKAYFMCIVEEMRGFTNRLPKDRDELEKILQGWYSVSEAVKYLGIKKRIAFYDLRKEFSIKGVKVDLAGLRSRFYYHKTELDRVLIINRDRFKKIADLMEEVVGVQPENINDLEELLLDWRVSKEVSSYFGFKSRGTFYSILEKAGVRKVKVNLIHKPTKVYYYAKDIERFKLIDLLRFLKVKKQVEVHLNRSIGTKNELIKVLSGWHRIETIQVYLDLKHSRLWKMASRGEIKTVLIELFGCRNGYSIPPQEANRLILERKEYLEKTMNFVEAHTGKKPKSKKVLFAVIEKWETAGSLYKRLGYSDPSSVTDLANVKGLEFILFRSPDENVAKYRFSPDVVEKLTNEQKGKKQKLYDFYMSYYPRRAVTVEQAISEVLIWDTTKSLAQKVGCEEALISAWTSRGRLEYAQDYLSGGFVRTWRYPPEEAQKLKALNAKYIKQIRKAIGSYMQQDQMSDEAFVSELLKWKTIKELRRILTISKINISVLISSGVVKAFLFKRVGHKDHYRIPPQEVERLKVVEARASDFNELFFERSSEGIDYSIVSKLRLTEEFNLWVQKVKIDRVVLNFSIEQISAKKEEEKKNIIYDLIVLSKQGNSIAFGKLLELFDKDLRKIVNISFTRNSNQNLSYQDRLSYTQFGLFNVVRNFIFMGEFRPYFYKSCLGYILNIIRDDRKRKLEVEAIAYSNKNRFGKETVKDFSDDRYKPDINDNGGIKKSNFRVEAERIIIEKKLNIYLKNRLLFSNKKSSKNGFVSALLTFLVYKRSRNKIWCSTLTNKITIHPKARLRYFETDGIISDSKNKYYQFLSELKREKLIKIIDSKTLSELGIESSYVYVKSSGSIVLMAHHRIVGAQLAGISIVAKDFIDNRNVIDRLRLSIPMILISGKSKVLQPLIESKDNGGEKEALEKEAEKFTKQIVSLGASLEYLARKGNCLLFVGKVAGLIFYSKENRPIFLKHLILLKILRIYVKYNLRLLMPVLIKQGSSQEEIIDTLYASLGDRYFRGFHDYDAKSKPSLSKYGSLYDNGGKNQITEERKKWNFKWLMEQRMLRQSAYIDQLESIFNECMNPDARILEIGSGAGTLWLLSPFEHREKWVSLDSDFQALRLAESMNNGESFIDASVFNLPFKDNLFDCIIGLEVFPYFDNLEGVLLEVNRVLKKSGKFINLIDYPCQKYSLAKDIQRAVLKMGLEDIAEFDELSFWSSDLNEGCLKNSLSGAFEKRQISKKEHVLMTACIEEIKKNGSREIEFDKLFNPLLSYELSGLGINELISGYQRYDTQPVQGFSYFIAEKNGLRNDIYTPQAGESRDYGKDKRVID